MVMLGQYRRIPLKCIVNLVVMEVTLDTQDMPILSFKFWTGIKYKHESLAYDKSQYP